MASAGDKDERVQTDAALAASEEEYRTIFAAIDEGYCVSELIFDDAGAPVDLLHVKTNSSFERLVGIENTVGKTSSELFPNFEPHWLEPCIRVVATGESERYEDFSSYMDRWFDVSVSRIGGVGSSRLAIGFNDTTERKRGEISLRESEARQAFLLKLSDALRPLADCMEIQGAASRLLGQQLGLTRCGYAEIDFAGEFTTVHQDYHVPDVAAFVGTYRLDDFGSGFIDTLRRGETLVIDDVTKDPAHANSLVAASHAESETRAMIAAPLVKEKRLVAVLFAHLRTARRWTSAEVALVTEVAERTWAAVERARAEAALKESEAKHRTVFEKMREGFVVLERVAGEPLDYRFVTANPAYERHSGLSNPVGKTMREIALTADAALDCYRITEETGLTQTLMTYVPELDRWFGVEASPAGRPGQVAVLFRDITERKRAELAVRENQERQAFLLKLSDALRAEPNAEAVANRAVRMLFAQMGLDRCYIGIYRLAEDMAEFPHQVHDDRLSPVPAEIRLSDFPESLKIAFERTLVIDNVAEQEEFSDSDRVSLGNLGLCAFVAATLHKGENNPLWAIVAGSMNPRAWTQGEVSLIEEVTERTWAAVERARAEAALRESEERYRHIVEGADDFAIVALGAHGLITAWNTGAQRLLGYSESEAVGRHGEMFFTAEDRAAGVPADEMARARSDGRAINERWHVRQDGSRFWGSGLMMRRDLDGGGYLKMFRDRTAEYETEAALHESEARLRELNQTLEERVADRTAEKNRVWSTSRGLLMIANLDGVFQAVNPAWTRTLGYTEAETIGRSYHDFIVHDDVQPTVAMLKKAASGMDVDGFENRYRHKDGSIHSLAWNTSVEKGLIYAFGRDVTDERAREAEMQSLEQQLRQAQKMEAMGSLTGGVAHDFNNLLTPILGSLDMLQRKGVGNEREQRLIAGALQSADRAKTLVQRLLAFARRQPLQTTSVDLSLLVRGMAELVSSTTGPQIKVVVDAAEDLPPAKADPNQLEMAILNLAVNARDAMPEGGTVRITVDAETVGRQHRANLAPGRYLRLSVADTGVGMDEETLRRAIEPFFSTKGVGKGTGLGLSMVHGLASQLGGAITIRTTLGVGTTVDLWLPQSVERLGEMRPVNQVAPFTKGCGIALLVDDEDLVRLSTADMLIDLGYTVVEAASAEEALKLVDHGLQPDVLVTDHLMPGMTGTELARMLQGSRPATKVLVVSGYAEAEGVAPDLPRLTKPFRSVDLARSLAALR